MSDTMDEAEETSYEWAKNMRDLWHAGCAVEPRDLAAALAFLKAYGRNI